jgi:hypothetical protein
MEQPDYPTVAMINNRSVVYTYLSKDFITIICPYNVIYSDPELPRVRKQWLINQRNVPFRDDDQQD